MVIIVFLFHFRSAFIPILTLPIAVVASFIPMYYLQVSSNIMSLGGLALAIGVLVDAAIVMVENGYRHLSEAQQPRAVGATRDFTPGARSGFCWMPPNKSRPRIFFSLLIIVVSFLPVFLLEAQEGRMFRPLAWTKTLAVGFSSSAGDHAGAVADADVHSGTAAAGIAQPDFARHAGDLSPRS